MSAVLLEISGRQKPPPNDGAPKAQRSKYTAFYVFFNCYPAAVFSVMGNTGGFDLNR